LVFVLIPAAVVAAVFAVVYGASARRSKKRYRPGRPFAFSPVWFVAAPEKSAARGSMAELTAGERLTASAAGMTSAAAVRDAPALAQQGQTGGASDSW
jgi:hypothetical protein